MNDYQDETRTDGDTGDARAAARRALQDAYDWRDDQPRAAAGTATQAPTPGQRSAAARSEARRTRRQVARSISRTFAV